MDAPYTAFAAVYDALMHDVPYDRWAQRLDALLRAALAAPAGDKGRNRNIEGKKKRKSDKFGLGGQANCCNRIGAQRADHHRIHHADETDQD